MHSRLCLVVLTAMLVSALGVAGSFGKVGGKRGTEGPDVMRGGPGHNTFSGLGGDDSLFGFGGHDYLFGGEGNDIVTGGDGPDELYGELGSNRLIGGKGNDYLEGWGSAPGAVNKLNGGPGDEDVCTGGEVDRISPSCEAVGRNTGEKAKGIVCHRGCDLLMREVRGTVVDKRGKVLKRHPKAAQRG